MPDPRSLRPGDPQRLGPYQLVGLLGEGAQGAVYLGEARDGRQVAVKMLHARIAGDDKARRRIMREVDAARQVRQFCTAQVLDVATTGDSFYIVSEYVPGESLKQLVAREGPRDGGALERLAVGTASALAAIHQAGIVHRDFKPQNVLMGPDGPRVIDFGIARTLDATASETTGPVGTPAYMSPEQITSGEIDPSADVFAWGGTMVFAATGSPAFGKESVPVVMYRILNADPDLSGIPDPLRDVVAAALAKQPERRPTATEVLLSMLGDRRAAAARRTRQDQVDQQQGDPQKVDYGALLEESLAVVARTGEAARSATDPRDPTAASAPPEHPEPADSSEPSGLAGPDAHRPRRTKWLAVGALTLALMATAVTVPVVVHRSGPVTLSGHTPTVSAVAFRPDGKVLTTVDTQTVRSWDVRSHHRIGAPLSLTLLVSAVAFSPDGKVLATGGGDEMVRLWDVATRRQVAALNHDASVSAVAFSPDGSTLATGGDDGTVRLWDLATRRQVAALSHHGSVYGVDAVAFSPAGGTLAAGGGDGAVRLWDLASRREVGPELTGHDGGDYGVNAVVFSPDGRTLATGGTDDAVRLWQVSLAAPSR